MQNDTKYLLILTITEWIFLITFFFCLYLARTADHNVIVLSPFLSNKTNYISIGRKIWKIHRKNFFNCNDIIYLRKRAFKKDKMKFTLE